MINTHFCLQIRNNLQRAAQPANNPSQPASNVPVNNPIAAGPTYDRNNETITDDVIEISPEIDNPQPNDDDLER